MVEWKKLGEIGDVCMCKRIMKNETSKEGEIPFYKIGTFGKKADAYISKALFEDYRSRFSYPKQGDILISAAGTIGRSVIFNGENAYFQDSNIVWINNNESIVSNRFLFYIYQVVDWKTDGGTIKRLYNYNLKNTEIPTPPLSEQNRIVGILDTFTESIENLKKQISERKKQYEHYRDQLLDLEGKPGVELKTLGEIGDVCMCKRIMKMQTSDEGEIPFYKIGTFGGTADSYISKKLFEDYKSRFSYPKKGDILISAAGTIGRSVIFNGEDAYFQDSNIVWIDNDESIVSNKFLYYVYQIIDWKTDGGTIKRLYNYNLKNTIITIPPLSQQSRIVTILDTFEASITNLEAQLSLRQKQYEYYRNMLLTFDEWQTVIQSIDKEKE